MSRRPVLYIAYDGLLEPLGRSQVLAYLERLALQHDIHVLSFEKVEDEGNAVRLARLEKDVRAAGLRWTHLRYHREPTLLATAYDVLVGVAAALRIALASGAEVVHARSYIPAVIGWPVKVLLGRRLLFDMRGFWPDQKRDCGGWRQGGLAYRLAKSAERRLLLDADHVVTLTRAARAELGNFPYLKGRKLSVSVIPTCVDIERYKALPTKSPSPFVLGCVGTVTISYLFDRMLEFYAALRTLTPNPRLLVLNRGEHAFIRERLRACGIPEAEVELVSSEPEDAPRHIARMSAGMFFLKNFPSMKGVAPTKLGELLACGVPCAANPGIGDYDEILRGERVGIVVESYEKPALSRHARELVELTREPDIRARCVRAASVHFSLEVGVREYARIYSTL